MKLWLLYQNEVRGYDTYDSVVVAAETEDEARSIHPSGGDCDEHVPSRVWSCSAHVNVEYLGEAAKGIEKGVICASFNAG